MFYGLSEEEIDVTPDICFTEFTEFDNKNGSYDGDEFIWKIEYIRDSNSCFWHQKYSLPCTRVIGFVACRVTSTVLGIGTADCLLSDLNIIKSGKRSAISSGVSEKYSIVYNYSYIGSATIK